MEADYPSFYVGGNPFICTDTQAHDPCYVHGTATWPFWVPSAHLLVDWPKNRVSFQEKLVDTRPPKSERAALIYLGWAMHMLADLSVEHHALDKANTRHTKNEDEMDEDVADLYNSNVQFSSEETLRIPELLLKRASHEEMCGRFGLSGTDHPDDRNVEHMLSEMKAFGKTEPSHSESLKRAIGDTAKMIACFSCGKSYHGGNIDGQTGVRYDGCTVDFKNVTVDSSSDICITATNQVRLGEGFRTTPGARVKISTNPNFACW